MDLIRSDRALMGLILIYCAYGAGQHGVNAIFYPFLDSVLRAGPAVFGLSVSLYFGSGLAAGVLLAKYGRIVRRIPPVAVAALSAVSWITHSFVRLVPVSLALDVIDGLGMFILTNLLTSEVQSRSPADMTGRVWGLTQTLTSTSEVLGVLAAGTIGERWGPAFAFRAAGLAGLAAVTAAFLTSRAAARGRPRPTEARG